MNPSQISDLRTVTMSLYQASTGVFWTALPVAVLISLLVIYASGEISGAKLESLFRRLCIAIALLVAFPMISGFLHDLEAGLISTFGGDASLQEVFSKFGDRAEQIKDTGTLSWLKVGQLGLSVISTLSFLVLAVVKRFLDVLHLSLWNLMHILAPLALLGCLFPSMSSVPRGIFLGLFELVLWKPVWVILAKILLALGFGETPADASRWFDIAVMNFAVAGLMACSPALVHGFLSGALTGVGGSAIQTMLAGAGAAMARFPMQTIQGAYRWTHDTMTRTGQSVVSGIRHRTPRRTSSQPGSHKK